MSGVPKSKRHYTDRLEVLVTMKNVRKELTKYLLKDYDKMTQNGELPKELLRNLVIAEINYLRDITDHVTIANNIYVTCQKEYEERRLHQDYAIAICRRLANEIEYMMEIAENININKYARSIEHINKTVNMIKAWRKSDNRLKNK